jgi:carboxylate-amine ligase
MQQPEKPLGLFQGFGIEMEYMLVQEPKLSVYPVVDKILKQIAGEYVDEVELDDIAWSNELVLHVLELKTNGPVATLNGLAARFQHNINHINQLLASDQAKLMPTGAHPFMNPDTESVLWPHGYNEIYEIYNRLFNCRGHGWSNLQSTHLNLPFANDAEFAVLHTAIRLLLPIMPALAASTPILDGKITGMVDTRLQYYLDNQAKIPSITGHVIPESVLSREDYEANILAPIYRDIAPHDPNKLLQFEWVNSRGAIARFDRNAIEIRTLDIQECPLADIAIAALITSTLQAIAEERWDNFSSQAEWSEQQLSQIWRDVIRGGQATVIQDTEYLAAFGYVGDTATARDLWQHIYTQIFDAYTHYDADLKYAIEYILEHGNLSERILTRLRKNNHPDAMMDIYRELTVCLAKGKMFNIG